MAIASFIRKNLVAIVMIPAIIGAHYGWKVLQEQDSLVKPEERKGLPLYTIMEQSINYVKGTKEKTEE